MIKTSSEPRVVPPGTALVTLVVLMMLAYSPASLAEQSSRAPSSYSPTNHSADPFPLPQSIQGQPGAQDFQAGREAALQGRWDQALELFNDVIEQNPGTDLIDDATYWSARCLHELGNNREAVDRVNQLISEFSDSPYVEDAKILRIDAATVLVHEGEASYSRYLREAAAPPAPAAPTAGVREGAAPADPAAPVAPSTGVEPPPYDPPPPDPETELRLYALNALVGMGADEAWPLLQKVLSDSDDPVMRRRAIMVLGQVDHPDAFQLLVELARSDADIEVRRDAVFWMSQSSEHSDEAAQVLSELAMAPGDEELRQRAIFALGQTDSPLAQETLRNIALDSSLSAETRGAALMWLSESGAAALDLLREVITTDPDLEMRKRALFSLSQVEGQEAANYLLDLARSDADQEIRKTAIFFLVQREDVASVDLLIELFDQETDSEIRTAVLFSLGQAEKNDAAISKLIDVAKNDPDMEMRQAAVMWLGQSDDPRARQALIDIIGTGPFDASGR